MGILDLMMRPWEKFDPANKEHRKYYAEFMQLGNWSRCPVRFVDPTDCGNLAMAMQASMARYYTTKEFGKIKPCAKRTKKVQYTHADELQPT